MTDEKDIVIKQQTIAFVTSNDAKVKEFERILSRAGSIYKVEKTNEKLDEPSNPKDLKDLVRLKTIAAFKKYKMPVVVEHTLLDIAHLYGIPGYVTDYVTSKMNNYSVCELLRCTNNRHAVAKTLIGYCDGKKVHIFEGVVKGTISNMPRGENGFGWDSIFIPDDKDAGGKTFGQMSEKEKDSFSMRKKAIDELVDYLIKNKLSYYDQSNKNLEALLSVFDLVEKVTVTEAIAESPATVATVEEAVAEVKEDEATVEETEEAAAAETAEATASKTVEVKVTKKKLILFIGAGVSRNVDFVSWFDLLLNMAEKMGYDREIARVLTDNPIELAEFCMQKDKAAVRDIFADSMEIKTELKQTLYKSAIYRSIIDIDPTAIYTTNYDESIETAYDLLARDLKEKQTITGLGSKDTNRRVTLNKIHGNFKDLSNIKSVGVDKFEEEFNKIITLTEQSYLKSFDLIQSGSAPFEQLLTDLTDSSNIFLFLGYGMGDLNIKYLIHKARQKKFPSGSSADDTNGQSRVDKLDNLYFFTTKAEPVQEAVLTGMGVKIIYGDNPNHRTAMENFLYKLVEKKLGI